jgi:release factor glutamine methyltransferase
MGRVLKQSLRWRYRNFRPGAQADREVKVSGLRLTVLRGAFDPSAHLTSPVLADYIRRPGVVPQGSAVLDLGAGTGIVAITAALAGAGRVVATDINPAAVRSCTINVERYRVADHVEVRQGDMFEPVAYERFDIIVCNPPYFRGEPNSMADRAYWAGTNFEWIDRFATGAHEHLSPDGRCLVVLGDSTDVQEILARFERAGWRAAQVDCRDYYFEYVHIYCLIPRDVSPGIDRL